MTPDERERAEQALTKLNNYIVAHSNVLNLDASWMVKVIEEARQAMSGIAEAARREERKRCEHAVCAYCAQGTKLRGKQHELMSNITGSGYYYVDCAAEPIRALSVLDSEEKCQTQK